MSKASEWVSLQKKHKPPVLELTYGKDNRKIYWSLSETGGLYISSDWLVDSVFPPVSISIDQETTTKLFRWMQDTFGEEESA